jgi:tetratricopeptide (TPR) repeat protein
VKANATRKVRASCVLIIALSFLAIVPAQQRVDKAMSTQASLGEFLYVPEGSSLRRLCLGHEGLLANIYWTRAVQYFGRKRIDESPRMDLLGPLLRIATDLDPQLLIAYRFGAIFLAEKPPRGAGKPEEALQLLRKGIVANPDYWRLWQDLGFIYYWDLKDYDAAARAYQAGSERPGAHQWMKVMAATVAAEGGAYATSRLLWSQIYREAENEQIRRNAEEHLAAFSAQDDLSRLNLQLEEFAGREGRPASSWQDLTALGMLREIPRDPSGTPYRIGRDGRAQLGPGSKVDLKLLQ